MTRETHIGAMHLHCVRSAQSPAAVTLTDEPHSAHLSVSLLLLSASESRRSEHLFVSPTPLQHAISTFRLRNGCTL